MPEVVTSNLECPECAKKGVEGIRLKNVQGRNEYYCDAGGHKFRDTEELMAMKPRMLTFIPPVKRPPEGAATLTIPINGEALTKLRERFGVKLEGAVVSVMGSLLEPDSFVVDHRAAKKMEDVFGKKPRYSDELAGMVFALNVEKVQALSDLKDARAAAGGGGQQVVIGGITLAFEPEIVAKLVERATFNGKKVVPYLQETILYALEQGWF